MKARSSRYAAQSSHIQHQVHSYLAIPIGRSSYELCATELSKTQNI